MATLAYDPDRLALLATALGDAVDTLVVIHSSDPDAQQALTTVASATSALDSWRHTALLIAGCNVLEMYQPISAAHPDIANAAQYVLAQLYGWRLGTDATGEAWTVPARVQGAALGYLISSGQVTLDDVTGVAALRTALAAALADPEGAAALAANLTAAGAATAVEQLGQRRAELVVEAGGPSGVAASVDPEALAAIATVDAALAAIGNIVIDVDRPVADAQAALAEMTPYSAALLVSHLDAPEPVIRLLAVDTLRRYAESDNDPDQWEKPWEAPAAWQFGIGDFLFPRVAEASPATANRFVVDVLALSPDLLFTTVADDGSTTALLATATNPDGVAVAAAGDVIVPLLGYLQAPPTHPQVGPGLMPEAILGTRNALGAIIGPWFAQFSKSATAWGWSEREANDAFRFVIANDQAFADVLAASEHWLDSMPLDPSGDPEALFWQLEHLGKVVGQLGTLLKLRGADAVMADRMVWDSFTKHLPRLLNQAAGKAGLSGVPAKIAAKVIGLGVAKGKELAEEHGAPGAPPPLEEALAQLDLEQDQVHAAGAYLAMGSMLEVLIARGLPADTDWPPSPLSEEDCPSGTYMDVTDEWLQDLDLDWHDTAALIAARSAFLGGAQSEQTCVELTDG